MESAKLSRLHQEHPIINRITMLDEVFWINPKQQSYSEAILQSRLTNEDILDAEKRLERFAPYIKKAYPETAKQNGIIESPLVRIDFMKDYLERTYKQKLSGNLLLKCDSHMPISGSIKARGGIYEVLKHAEKLAFEHHLLNLQSDYSIMDDDKFRDFYSQYSIAVGSTGNLGLSIGIISAKLGFKVTVHMSADAKEWKKELLRTKGVSVIEYKEDYSKAVEEGRKQAESDLNCYFIDDENSQDLFLGYAVAASRLKTQLEEMTIKVDEEHPLFVYLPCGVGGGPGGVAYGLKQQFKDNVHCFFAEPTHSPCMLLGLVTGLHDRVSVQDFGIDNKTAADGLAVGRPSGFVGKTIEPFLSGSYTISDSEMYKLLSALTNEELIRLEPSALAGMKGPVNLFTKGSDYLQTMGLINKIKNATHIVWGTGGSMVPAHEMSAYYKKGAFYL